MNHIVTGCMDCCMCSDTGYSHYCQHPSMPIDKQLLELDSLLLAFPLTPDECPLKKETITIVFDNKE